MHIPGFHSKHSAKAQGARDLLLRGPGNLLGKKQSGHLPEFPIARLEIDGGILQEADHSALVSSAREGVNFLKRVVL